MEACCSPAVAALGCALMFSLASCYITRMIVHGRNHVAKVQLQIAQLQIHADKQRTAAGATMLSAFPLVLLLIGMGCSGGLLALEQKRQDIVVASASAKCTPDNCKYPKKCVGNTCTTQAVTDGLVPGPAPTPTPRPVPPRASNPSTVFFDGLAVLPRLPDNPNRPPDGIN